MRILLTVLLSFIIIVSSVYTAFEESLSELTDHLQQQTDEIKMIDTKIIKKTEEILGIEANLKSMQSELKQQYDDMKLRIKYMYENESNSIESIFNQTVLSKTEYKMELMKYDREKLDEIQDTINEIKEKKEKLVDEKEELEKMKKESSEKKNTLEKEIKNKKKELEEEQNIVSQAKNVINTKTELTYTTTNDYGYSDQQLDLICAIVAQECSTSYDGALAVITCAMNRCESAQWRYNGLDPLSQLCARGQFCYSIDGQHKKRLNGNYSDFVKQAVLDCLNGKRNHNYLSFRGYQKPGSINIGDNWYFNQK